MEEITVTDVSGAPGSASLLVQHGKRAFMYDMGFGFCAHKAADKAEEILDGGRPECIILTHSHYDHVMGSAVLAERWKGVPVIAGEYTAYVFTRPTAKKLMGEMDDNAADELGFERSDKDYTPYLHVDKAVRDGEVIDVCGLRLETVAVPGHTKCSLGFYCHENKTLFSSETLGVYDGESAIPIMLTSCIQGDRSLEKAAALGAENIVLPHWGMIRGKDICSRYFEKTVERYNEMKDMICSWHRENVPEDEIVERIRKIYHTGYIKEIYPMKAFYLNTGIMVPLIIKEYCMND